METKQKKLQEKEKQTNFSGQKASVSSVYKIVCTMYKIVYKIVCTVIRTEGYLLPIDFLINIFYLTPFNSQISKEIRTIKTCHSEIVWNASLFFYIKKDITVTCRNVQFFNLGQKAMHIQISPTVPPRIARTAILSFKN